MELNTETKEAQTKEVSKRLELVELIANHMAQQKKLIIEDDTCLIRILDNVKMVLKKTKSAKCEKLQKILNKLLHHCKLGLETNVESHKCFLISLFGILVSGDGICNMKKNETFIEYIKDFVRHIQLDTNATNTVLNSWLISFQNITSTNYFTAVENGFNVEMVCKATQSSSIFVARSAVKLLSRILIGLHSKQDELNEFEVTKRVEEINRTVKFILELNDFDAYLKVFTEIAKVNVPAANTIESDCRTKLTPDYNDYYTQLYQHKISSAQQGTTIIANYVHAFHGHTNSRKQSMDVNLQNIAVEFVFCNPLREHSYKILVLMGKSQDCFEFAQKCLRKTLEYFVGVEEKAKRYDVARWMQVVEGCHDNKRDLVAKIICCTFDAIRELHTDTMREKHQVFRHLMLKMFTCCFEKNPIHTIGTHHCVVDNSKVQMSLLRNVYSMLHTEINYNGRGNSKNSLVYERGFFKVINKIPTTDINSSRMFKYVFQLTLLRFHTKVCSVESRAQIVNTDRFEQLLAYGLECNTTDWQYKDEVYEGVTTFFTDVVDKDAMPTRYHYQIVDALNRTNFIGSLLDHMTNEPTNYVRASAVTCATSLYYFYDKHMTGDHRKPQDNKNILLLLLKYVTKQLATEKDEIVQIKLVRFAVNFVENSPETKLKSGRFFSEQIQKMVQKNSLKQKLMIDFKKYLDDLDSTKNQGVFVTAVCEQVFRLARFEVDDEVRVECLKLIARSLRSDEKDKFVQLVTTLDDPALKIHVDKTLGNFPDEKVNFADLDSLLDDVTFRITSSDRHTRLHTHHGNQDEKDDVDCFHDESGREVHDVILDCY